MNGDTMTAGHRLIVYGTLAPGQVNEGQLSALNGEWQSGTVRGTLIEEGWGADHGCPGMVLDPMGAEIKVHVFTSQDLPDHWARLDAFEGKEYRRTETIVSTEEGELPAMIYQISV